MTKSIKTDSNGVVQTVYNGERDGDGWVQIPDREWPEVTEEDVAVTYHYDDDTVTVKTEPTPDDDDLL